ncbi:MAG: MBL fold metallo-hydrolase [Ignavibacteria bacterium]|nr:MBL fold metallo-hydrolase [Ignavibacteria bacterium]MBT8382243.1 MBL fold metallo-hydrolase [Ignavibacteria bacterium]MBT8390753.1 MBL fold metallo-hydrolase [Ignavibacteria bacterium]NNJ53422.1 MBL fold metallo-hydrolase [Ignavibacteriaceae bacterium]NNL22403.1 MBL fold metallo-hydrolase [Ignavibacteriaceae bacterium]
MKVKFYGTRGSIPVCAPEFQEFGGNTTCVQLRVKETNNIGIFDAGTGIRDLGKDYLSSGHQQKEIFIALTHFHWDHIQGFPFFAPAFIKNQNINLLALGWGKRINCLEEIFKTQMQKEYFPVQLEKMGANFNFMLLSETKKILEPEVEDPKPVIVSTNKHKHPGGAYGYRIERDGKVFVFCTDVEHGDSIDDSVVKLAKDANLLVHEAQYTTEELKEKKGWGHSSYEQALEVAERANVKVLVITHHDPDHDDEFLKKREIECQERFKDSVLAREKMEIEF